MKYQAYLTRNSDGVSRSLQLNSHSADDSALEFMWSGGNYGCDCNRKLFFERAAGVEIDVMDSAEAPCGEGAYSVKIVRDGKVVFADGVCAAD